LLLNNKKEVKKEKYGGWKSKTKCIRELKIVAKSSLHMCQTSPTSNKLQITLSKH